jgi:hypothetical protein
MAWLPDDFQHPQRVEVGADHHLRPIRVSDVDLDMEAVLGSQQRLFSIYGPNWNWPPATMTREQDIEDLQHHVDEMQTNESFNYALFDRDETRLLGCVYIDQPDGPDNGGVVSWWVVDDLVGTPLERALDETVPRWLAEEWPLRDVRFGIWSDPEEPEPVDPA